MIHDQRLRRVASALCLLLCASLWFASRAAMRQAQCVSPTLLAAGMLTETGAVGAAAGDFTADGAEDVAVVSRTQRRITIFNGNGQGAFARGRSFTLPEEPLDVRRGDFNGDRRPDLLVLYKVRFNAEEVEQLAVWLTAADGTLSQTTVIRLPETIPLVWLQLVVADLNGDGKSDIALGNNFNPAPLRIYLTDGGTTLSETLPFRAVLSASDVNGDARVDLVYTQFEPGRVFVQFGRAGGFESRQTALAAESVINGAALADFNGDGAADILLTTGERNGGASGTAGDSFQLQTLTWSGNGFNARRTAERRPLVLIGDVNGDGGPDAILNDGGDNRAVALGNGTGGFCATISYNPLRGVRLFADFDRDSKADAVTQATDNFVVWLNRSGSGANTPPTITPQPGATLAQGGSTSARLAVVADAETAAGRLRVELVAAPSGLRFLSLSNSDGTIFASLEADCALAAGEHRATLRVTDEAGAATTADTTITVQANVAPVVQSAPTSIVLQEGISATLAVAMPPYTTLSGFEHLIVFADPSELFRNISLTLTLAGREIRSLTINGSFNTNVYHLSAPAGEHTLRLTLTDRCGAQTVRDIPVTVRGASATCVYAAFEPMRVTPTGGALTALAVADFNSDGKADVAAADALNHRLAILLGQANGEWRAAANVPVRRAPYAVAAADFNRDGKPDLAVCNYRVEGDLPAAERGVSVLIGNGDGAFTLFKDYAVGHGELAVGDFNRDGAPDIAVAEVLQQRGVRVLLNDGRGDFIDRTTPLLQTLGNQAGLVAAHINRDDTLDLASNGSLRAFARPFYPLLGNGAGGFAPDYSLAAYENFGDFVHAGDFDGDGKSDLAVSFFGTEGLPTLDTASLLLPGKRYRNLFPQALVAADFNLDGKPDVALNTGGVMLSGTPGPFCAIPPLFAAGRPGAGDFNGDGKTDLIAAADGRLLLYLNRTGQPNTAPTIAAVAPLTRVQGGAAGNAVTIATVNDAETPRGNLLVAATSVPPGLTLANLTNTDGVITATVAAACNAATGANTVVLSVTDAAGAVAAANFIINVTSNAAPTLGEYPSQPVAPGSTVTLTPTAPPRDDGTIESVTVTAFALTTLSVDPTTGVVTITNAGGPAGNHTVGVSVRDNCGATTNRAFGITLAQPLTNVSAASYRGPELAPEQIAVAFGGGLASGTQAATTLPLPLSLLGVSVLITDSAGVARLAPLFFVSPQQINYLVPPDAAPGLATALVNTNPVYGMISMGTLRITPVAPGLFTADASGSGSPIGLALRVKADGTQTSEPLARFDQAANRFVGVPIDLGPEGEQVFLILYGTGLRHRAAAANVSVNLGGIAQTPTFAGAQGALVGVDQINVLLPRGLSGRGEVEVGLNVEGATSNSVRVIVR